MNGLRVGEYEWSESGGIWMVSGWGNMNSMRVGEYECNE